MCNTNSFYCTITSLNLNLWSMKAFIYRIKYRNDWKLHNMCTNRVNQIYTLHWLLKSLNEWTSSISKGVVVKKHTSRQEDITWKTNDRHLGTVLVTRSIARVGRISRRARVIHIVVRNNLLSVDLANVLVDLSISSVVRGDWHPLKGNAGPATTLGAQMPVAGVAVVSTPRFAARFV